MFYVLSPWLLQNVVWIPTRLGLRYFIHLSITGRETVDKLQPGVIFAANHTSALDPILLPASLSLFSEHLPIFYTSREKSFYNISGLFSEIIYSEWFFNAWGAYRVQTGLNNYKKSLRVHEEILNDNRSVLIFPEGGTAKEGEVKPAKGGVGYLAHATGKPVVPVAFKGVYGVTPRRFFTRRHHITVEFGDPLHKKDLFDTDSPDPDDYKRAASHIMKVIVSMLGSRRYT